LRRTLLRSVILLGNVQKVQVSDTTGDNSSTSVEYKFITTIKLINIPCLKII